MQIGANVDIIKEKTSEGEEMSNCRGECCVCACGGFCLAGNGDDDFIPASKERIMDNLKNGKYPRYRDYMIEHLKRVFDIDYENA